MKQRRITNIVNDCIKSQNYMNRLKTKGLKINKTKSCFFERLNKIAKTSGQAHREERRDKPNKQNKK